MKILIPGGAGYVGSVLTRHLWQQGHDITVLDLLLFGDASLNELQGKPRFQLIQGDIRNSELLRQVVPGHEAICLLAAIVGEPACNRDEANAHSTNYDGALNVLRAAQETQVKRFVFTSTCSNYGIADSSMLATEQSALQPLSAYSRSKVAAELDILAAASDTFCPTVLRLSTAFGASWRMRFDLLVNDFTLAAFRDRKISIYGGQFWRPFVHTQDIAEAIEQVLLAPREVVCGEVFNIGAERNNLQKSELGQQVRDFVPGTELEFTGGTVDPRSYRVDFSKSATQLGFTARLSVLDGIREIHDGLVKGRWLNPADPNYYN
jgi:nucleoside-diphosphate-sugar epimerase